MISLQAALVVPQENTFKSMTKTHNLANAWTSLLVIPKIHTILTIHQTLTIILTLTIHPIRTTPTILITTLTLTIPTIQILPTTKPDRTILTTLITIQTTTLAHMIPTIPITTLILMILTIPIITQVTLLIMSIWTWLSMANVIWACSSQPILLETSSQLSTTPMIKLTRRPRTM